MFLAQVITRASWMFELDLINSALERERLDFISIAGN